MTKAAVAICVAEPAWRTSGVNPARIRAAARHAIARGIDSGKAACPQATSLTVLLAGDDRLRELNLRFRKKDNPTNVLSFPAPDGADGYLGDVAIALGVAVREAGIMGKDLADHALHLTVHGVLHLLGYDHQKSGEARTMERLEIKILHELGVANPYTMRG